jgi:hypothetical protein
VTQYLVAVAFFASGAGFVWLMLASERERHRRELVRLDGEIEILRREREVLLNTALEARGVAVVDPAGRAQRELKIAEQDAKRRRVAEVLGNLEAAASKRARDRDERVREQIEATNRLVKNERGEK